VRARHKGKSKKFVRAEMDGDGGDAPSPRYAREVVAAGK
jgi:hypothetical protein